MTEDTQKQLEIANEHVKRLLADRVSVAFHLTKMAQFGTKKALVELGSVKAELLLLEKLMPASFLAETGMEKAAPKKPALVDFTNIKALCDEIQKLLKESEKE